ncbi:MAG: MFS transporter [Desulfobacteraceae bacterium]|jgi:MFS family permease|nr:MFS transporter [Desulfobacteraceae bacterium]
MKIDKSILPSMKIFWGISSFQALAMFRRGLFYAFLSIYLRYFLGLSVTETTLFATLPMVFNILAQTFIWGRLSDRRQLRRTLILWGEGCGAVGTVLIWGCHILAPTPASSGYVIILGLTIVEIFWSMSNIGWSALISDLYPEKQRNAVLGYLTSIGGVGRLIGIWIGGLLYDGMGAMYEGWGFYSGALFFIPAAVMLFSMIPVVYLPEGGIRATETTETKCDAACQVASIKMFWIFLTAMVFINFGRNGVIIIQSQYLFLDTGFNVSSRVLGYIFNTESVAIICFGLLAGRLGRWVGDGPSVCLGAAIAIVYLLIYSLTDNLSWIYVASWFRGMADVIILASSYAFVSVLIPPERRGTLFSLFNATLFLSWGVAGTLIAGPIVDLLFHAGISQAIAYRAAYLSGLVMVIIGLSIQMFLVFVLMPKTGISAQRSGN